MKARITASNKMLGTYSLHGVMTGGEPIQEGSIIEVSQDPVYECAYMIHNVDGREGSRAFLIPKEFVEEV